MTNLDLKKHFPTKLIPPWFICVCVCVCVCKRLENIVMLFEKFLEQKKKSLKSTQLSKFKFKRKRNF